LVRGAEEEARKKRKLELTSFAKRVQTEPSEVRDTTTFGSLSMTFVPNDIKVPTLYCSPDNILIYLILID
jgi:hypothetical protein